MHRNVFPEDNDYCSKRKTRRATSSATQNSLTSPRLPTFISFLPSCETCGLEVIAACGWLCADEPICLLGGHKSRHNRDRTLDLEVCDLRSDQWRSAAVW